MILSELLPENLQILAVTSVFVATVLSNVSNWSYLAGGFHSLPAWIRQLSTESNLTLLADNTLPKLFVWLYVFSVILLGFVLILLMFVSSKLIRRRYVLAQLSTVRSGISELIDHVARVQGVSVPNGFLWNIDEPIAFVFGSIIGKKNLVLTSGLLETLNEDELKAMLHHETAHLRNRDVSFMTWSLFSVNCLFVWFTVSLIINFIQALVQGYSSALSLATIAGRPLSSGMGFVAGSLAEFLAQYTLLTPLIMLAPILLLDSISRNRELRADRIAALEMGMSEPLLNGLRKISGKFRETGFKSRAPGRLGPAGPVKPRFSVLGLFDTHPSIESREVSLKKLSNASALGFGLNGFTAFYTCLAVGNLLTTYGLPRRSWSGFGTPGGIPYLTLLGPILIVVLNAYALIASNVSSVRSALLYMALSFLVFGAIYAATVMTAASVFGLYFRIIESILGIIWHT